MLQKIRDNASGWLIKTILWGLVIAFVGTIFLVWGHGGEAGQKPVATVGDYTITNADYSQRYQNMTDRLRDSMGPDVDEDIIRSLQLDKQALESLIMEKLVFIAAEEEGLTISKDELKYAIANNSNFQTDGRFDKDLYFSVLRANELTPRLFEKGLKGDLLISKISRIIADSVYITVGETKEEFVKRNEQAKARYMILSAALFEGSVDMSAEAVSKYYDQNKIPYTRPEERKIEYLFSGYESFRDEIEISEEEKKVYYDTHQYDYSTEEKVRARHILLAMPPNPSEEKAAQTRKRAEDLMKEITEGADFAEMAKKHSDGPTKDVGGDLGIFERGAMLPEFEEVAFSMGVGDVSTPVLTRFGWHIIKVEEKLEAKLKEYDDVSFEVEIAIAKKKGEVMAKSAITSIARDKQKVAGSWEELADSKKIVYKETGVFRGKPVPEISDSAAIVKRAFDMATGDRAGPLELKNGFYLIRLLDVVPPRERELSEVRGEVEEKMKKEESKRIAREIAEKILARLRGGENFGDVAKEMGLEIKEAQNFKRKSEIEGIPGASFSRKAFKLKVGEFDATLVGDKNYIMELLEKKPPADADFEKEKNDIMQALKSQKNAQAVSLWRLKLREDAQKKGLIKIEPGFT